MLKVGLIGAGFMGDMHATCYKKLGIDICAVADVRATKAKHIADIFHADVYEDGMTLIDQAEVDIIDICLPTYLHCDHAIEAIKKNRHVFLEKPVCLNETEAKRLLACQASTNKLLMVGQCIRLWDEYMYLKEIADSKIYGDINTAVFKRIGPKPDWSWNNWLHQPKLSGSVALDMHIHDSDFIRYLLGEPLQINSVAGRDKQGAIQQLFTSYQYAKTTVLAEVCWDYPPSFPFYMEYRVKFEKATIVYHSASEKPLIVYPLEGESFEPTLKNTIKSDQDLGGNVSLLGGYYNELEYFVNAITHNKEIEVAPLSEGIKSVLLVLQEIKSAGGLEV